MGPAQEMYRAAITGPAAYGEDVMAAKRRWSDLDESTRKLIITVAVAEGILKVAALIDIKRRPTRPDPGSEVAVGPRGSSGQLRGGRTDLIFRLRSAAAAVAIRRTDIAAREPAAGFVEDMGLTVAHKAGALGHGPLAGH